MNQIIDKKTTDIRVYTLILAVITFCARGEIARIIGLDSIIFTALANILLLISWSPRISAKYFVIVIMFSPLMAFNKDILNAIDIILCVTLLYAHRISLIKISKIILTASIFIFILQWAALKVGLISEGTWYSPRKGHTYDFGFGNPNKFGAFLLNIVIPSFILIWHKYGIFRRLCWIALVIALNEWVYSRSGSRAAYYSVYSVIAIVLLQKTWLVPRWSKYIIAVLPIFFFIASIYLTINISQYDSINEYSSNRLGTYIAIISQMSWINYLFGINVPDNVAMDNSFLMLWFNGGLFLIFIFCITFLQTIVKHYDKVIPFLPIIISILMIGLVESRISTCSGLAIIFWYISLHNSLEQYNTKGLSLNE